MAACGSGSTTGDGSEPSFEKTVFFSTAPNDRLRDLSSVSPQPEGKETFSADDAKLFLGSYSLGFNGTSKSVNAYTDRGSYRFTLLGASKLPQTTNDGKSIIEIDYKFENHSTGAKESPDNALRWVFYASASPLPGTDEAKALLAGSGDRNDVPIFKLSDVDAQLLKAPDTSQFTSDDPQVKDAQEPQGYSGYQAEDKQKTYSSLFVAQGDPNSTKFSLAMCTNGKGLTPDIYCQTVQPLEATIK